MYRFALILALVLGASSAHAANNCALPSGPCNAATFTAGSREITPFVQTWGVVNMPDAGAFYLSLEDGGVSFSFNLGGTVEVAPTIQNHDIVNLPDAGRVLFSLEDGGASFQVNQAGLASSVVSSFDATVSSNTLIPTAFATGGVCTNAASAQTAGGTCITNNGTSIRLVAPTSAFFLKNSGFPDAGVDAFVLRNEVTWADTAVIIGMRNGSATVDKVQVLGDGTIRQQSTGTFSGPVTALKSATTSVDVSAATAPATGQALIATGASAATWQATHFDGTLTNPSSVAAAAPGGAGPTCSSGTVAATGATVGAPCVVGEPSGGIGTAALSISCRCAADLAGWRVCNYDETGAHTPAAGNYTLRCLPP